MSENKHTNGQLDDDDPIRQLAVAVNHLTERMEDFMRYSKNSMDIKIVAWMFMILVLTIVGVEGSKFLFNEYLPKVLKVP